MHLCAPHAREGLVDVPSLQFAQVVVAGVDALPGGAVQTQNKGNLEQVAQRVVVGNLCARSRVGTFEPFEWRCFARRTFATWSPAIPDAIR